MDPKVNVNSNQCVGPGSYNTVIKKKIGGIKWKQSL